MDSCKHENILTIFYNRNGEAKIREYICEDCSDIFTPCPLDEQVAKTPEHMKICPHCKCRKKKTKTRVIKDSWQEQLLEVSKKIQSDEKPKKKLQKR